jgi:hypothetical protein
MRACGIILKCFMNVFACVKNSTGDSKPSRPLHECDFSPTGMTINEFVWASRVWPWAGFYHAHPEYAILSFLLMVINTCLSEPR